MDDLHEMFPVFKKDFPEIYQGHEALGNKIHDKGGPLACSRIGRNKSS